MKQFIISLLVMLAVPFMIAAKDAPRKIIISHKTEGNTRPSKPSDKTIDIFVSDEALIFDLPEYVEYMTVELKQGDAVVLTGMVDHEDASLDVTGLSGEYEILCRTDGNQLFAGYIEL